MRLTTSVDCIEEQGFYKITRPGVSAISRCAGRKRLRFVDLCGIPPYPTV